MKYTLFSYKDETVSNKEAMIIGYINSIGNAVGGNNHPSSSTLDASVKNKKATLL